MATSLWLVMVGCSADGASQYSEWDSSAGDSAVWNGDGATASVSGVRVLDTASADGIELTPGEVIEIRIVLTNLVGGAVEGARTEIALIGQSMNSTTSLLVGYSDLAGEVAFYLQAGSAPTSFQLRVTVGWVEIYVPVTVLDRASSVVQFSVESSTAATLESATVRAYANRTCDEIDDAEPASATVSADGGSTAIAASVMLYESTVYAVRAMAQTATGPIVESCEDGVTVDSTMPVVVYVP